MQHELNIIPAGGAIKHHHRTAGKARIQPAPKVGRWVQGELTSPLLAVQRQDAWPWGFQGSLEAPAEWGSIGQSIVHGAVQVERHVSRSCEGSNGDTFGWRDKAQCRYHATSERDATGERSVSLAKMVLYYNTHLAEHVKS